MSVWFLQIGKLAFATHNYNAIGGYKKLWWRLWWRLPEKPLPPQLLGFRTPLEQHKVLPNIHWCPDGVYPYCGEPTSGSPWTLEYNFASCEKCKLLGYSLYIQSRVNTR